MGLWDSVTGFFSDIGDFFSGKDFFECSGYIWNDLMSVASSVLTKNPATGTYKDTWEAVTAIYTTLNVVAVALLGVFFLYGFCRDSCDLHADLTFERTIKMFIRLIITSNVMNLALSWMPKFMLWGKNLTKAILGDTSGMTFEFDGGKIYEEISSSDFGTMTAFLTSLLFFLFTCVDQASEHPRLRYVFDIADVHPAKRIGKKVYLWQLREEHKEIVLKDLEKTYGQIEIAGSFEKGVSDMVRRVALDYAEELLEDVLYASTGSFMEELDEGMVLEYK